VMSVDIQISDPYVAGERFFNGYNGVIDIAKSLCPGSIGMMISAQGIKDHVGFLIQYFYHALPGCTGALSGPFIDSPERGVILRADSIVEHFLKYLPLTDSLKHIKVIFAVRKEEFLVRERWRLFQRHVLFVEHPVTVAELECFLGPFRFKWVIGSEIIPG